MKLRRLKLTTETSRKKNVGSNRNPVMRLNVETVEEEILQFSDDAGATWQDVPIEFEFRTRSES